MKLRARSALVALTMACALGAVAASPALASGKPSAETKPATEVGETSATLHGVVNPNGAETQYYFIYGTTKSGGTKTTILNAGSGTSNVNVAQAVTGLSKSTRYYFHLVAINNNGLSTGATLGFSSLPEPEFSIPSAEFKGTIGATSFLFEGTKWESGSGKISGKITGHNEVAGVVLTFESETGTAGCDNSGKSMVTTELVGRLGYLNKTNKEVGLLLEPVSGPVATCTSSFFGTEEIVGSVIGKLTPVNTSTKSLKVSLNRTGAKEQEFKKFEGEEVIHELEDIWRGGEAKNKITIETSGLTLELPVNEEVKA